MMKKEQIENWNSKSFDVFNKDYFMNYDKHHHVFSHHLANGGIQKVLEEVAIELGYEEQLNKIKLLFKK